MSPSNPPQPSSPSAPRAPALPAEPTPPPSDEEAVLSRMFARMDAQCTSAAADGFSLSGASAAPRGPPLADDDDDRDGSDVDDVWEDAPEDLTSDAEEGQEGSEGWSLARLEAALDRAEDFKQRANSEFSPGKAFHQALTTYLSALACLPPRPAADKGKQKEAIDVAADGEDVRIEEVDEDEAARIEREPTEDEAQRERLEERCRVLRAVLWANMAAVYLKLDQNKEAVEACTEALKDDPTHVKALLRRSTANTSLGTWSSLTSAEDDLKTLLPLLPNPSPLRQHAQRELHALPPQIAQRAEAEKGEMLGKLKDLGNSLLGNFGLSTDNFKFEPNGQGGYAMNFVR